MKEVPIEKGTGQSDCEISANCDKKKSSNSCHGKIVVFFFFGCCTNCPTQRKEHNS